MPAKLGYAAMRIAEFEPLIPHFLSFHHTGRYHHITPHRINILSLSILSFLPHTPSQVIKYNTSDIINKNKNKPVPELRKQRNNAQFPAHPSGESSARTF
jgi:hypothetical protein